MLTLKMVEELTPEEVVVIHDLSKLALEAGEIESLILNHYLFKANQGRIKIWSDSHNAEYFNHTGTWEACYLHQHYTIECSKKCIFELARAKFMLDKKLYTNETERKAYEKQSEPYGYFMNFVDNTRKKVEQHE